MNVLIKNESWVTDLYDRGEYTRSVFIWFSRGNYKKKVCDTKQEGNEWNDVFATPNLSVLRVLFFVYNIIRHKRVISVFTVLFYCTDDFKLSSHYCKCAYICGMSDDKKAIFSVCMYESNSK